jgi:hypothetical protein
MSKSYYKNIDDLRPKKREVERYYLLYKYNNNCKVKKWKVPTKLTERYVCYVSVP